MNEVLIFGGTTEGRLFAKGLSENNVPSIYLAATSYGGALIEDSPLIQVRDGRLDSDEMKALIEEKAPSAIVDATHPYALEVKKCIKEALSDKPNIPYFRIIRSDAPVFGDDIRYFDNEKDLTDALLKTKGNIFLTTGTRSLPVFSKDESLRNRLFVRVIPSSESLSICEECKIPGDRIIAAQGPFSKEENLLMIKRANAKILVMKESGRAGGEEERIQAAREAGIKCFVIKRPVSEDGDDIEDVFEKVLLLFNKTPKKKPMPIFLIGAGTKYLDLTLEALSLIENAQFVFGAKRVLSFLPKSLLEGKDCFSYYRTSDIIPVLEKSINDHSNFFSDKSAVILFSGDSGFFSGAFSAYEAIKDDPRFDVRLIPGISSVSAFSSKLNEPWSDSDLLSSHGKKEEDWVPKLLDSALHNEKTYLLTSGNEDIEKIQRLLSEASEKGYGSFDIITGSDLGSGEERIGRELSYEEGPKVLFIKNNSPIKRTLSPFLRDDVFTRGSVPMTKEDVRAISVSRLCLHEGAVLYDIGCGTGSVSCAAAGLSRKLKVFSIDNNEEAMALTKENAKNLFLPNITPVYGTAPEILCGLPLPDSVFIGGSKGRLSDIIDYLFSLQKEIRVVINAVTDKTVSFIHNMLIEKADLIEDKSLSEVSVRPNNTIYIASFVIRPVDKND